MSQSLVNESGLRAVTEDGVIIAPVPTFGLPAAEADVPARWPRPVIGASIASLVWLALVAAALYLLLRGGLIRQVDATNVLAIGGSIFAPLSVFWLIGLTLLRAGSLRDDQMRLQATVSALLQPLGRLSAEAQALRERTDRDMARLQERTQSFDATVQALAPALDEQVGRMDNAAQRLQAAQGEAARSAAALQQVLDGINAMAEQVTSRLPEAAASVNIASTEVALHGEHLETAARSLTQVVSSARDSMAQLLPLLSRVTFQTHETTEGLSVKLSELREQAEETTQKLDDAGERASLLLENSRRWVDGQIEAMESSIARIEQDGAQRIEALAGQLMALDDDSSRRVADSLAMVQARVGQLDDDMRAQVSALRNDWDDLLQRADDVSGALGARLVDAMARARSVTQEAMNAAQTMSQGIISATEDAVATSCRGAETVAEEVLSALQSRAAGFNALAAEAQQHARMVQETLQTSTQVDLARLSALILERMNNAAIDVAKILSVEVSDDDWRSYMQGDRSLFTRRAARLADRGSESRIAEMVRHDEECRSAVDRFVRAFESLIRLTPADGQGQALGMALLSSDWGRLYIVLSRAIDRL
jgi:hypothetical protein